METLIWSIAMYGAEAWTVKKADQKRITTFENMAFRRMSISWKNTEQMPQLRNNLGETSIYTWLLNTEN